MEALTSVISGTILGTIEYMLLWRIHILLLWTVRSLQELACSTFGSGNAVIIRVFDPSRDSVKRRPSCNVSFAAPSNEISGYTTAGKTYDWAIYEQGSTVMKQVNVAFTHARSVVLGEENKCSTTAPHVVLKWCKHNQTGQIINWENKFTCWLPKVSCSY